MATTIITKNGTGAPLASDLVAGELAVDLTNKRLYTEDSGGTIIEVGTNPSGAVTFNSNATFSGTAEAQFRDSALKVSSSVDGQLDIDADVELEITAPTVDIDASTAVTIDTATLTVTGAANVTGDLDVDNININGNAIISTDTNGNIDLTPNGTGEVNISKVDIDSGAIDGTAIGANSASTGAFTTLTASTSLNIASSTTVDGVLDEDTMSSDSATKLATQQSIKAYVDSQVGANNDLSEVLANGNTTGANNIVVTAGQSITTDSILETTAAAGVDIDGVLLKDTSVGTDDASGTDVAGTAVTVKGGAGTGTGAGGSLVFQTAPAGSTGSSANAQVTALTIDSAGDATFTGASYNMSWDKSADSLAFADNAKAVFGAGSDLQIYHDSATGDSVITESGTGNFLIRGANTFLQNAAGTNTYLKGVDGGAVDIRYGGAVKLETTSTGIDVTGTVTADGLTVDGGSANNDSTAIAGKFNANGNEHIRLEISTDSTIGNQAALDLISNSNTSRIFTTGSTGLKFSTDGGTTSHLVIDGSGNLLVGGTATVGGSKFLVAGAGPSAPAVIQGASSLGAYLDFYNNGASTNKVRIGQGLNSGSDNIAVIFNHANADMAFGTNATERMRIDSSGNVQIGNSTYGSNLGQLRVISDATSAGAATPASLSLMGYGNVNDDAEVGKLEFAMQQTGTGGQVHAKISGLASGTGEDEGQLAFYTSDNTLTERMRLDENGNLLVGTTNATHHTGSSTQGITLSRTFHGLISASRSGAQPLIVNRQTNDGTIAEFRKDGSAVGSIGVASSNAYFGTGDAGIFTNSTSDTIQPFNTTTGAVRDALLDLGSSGARFKDLYLSGGVYVGGTGAANYLDDYEEGTWTPSLGGTWTSNPTSLSGTYTKIGRLVYITAQMSGGAKSTSISGYLEGLPISISTAATGSVSNSGVADYGNCLFANTDRVWLTETSFSGTVYISGCYLAA